ncbi:MAG: dihydroorotate dehydrogenase, partial [Candidatus Bathyarchaeota archaeon]|nr:dihydroorotate dehydrogenase [Candidatus Bathyarchaeota archaeon]
MLGSRCLKVEIAGLKLHNPTMLASGLLGITASSLRQVARAGAGAVVTKSIGLRQREGYKNPTTVQVECGLINAMGLPNPGIEEFKAEIEEAKDLEVPLIVSVYGFSAEEYAKAASLAVEAGADAVELNLSCPHVEGTGTEMGQNPTAVTQVVSEVKRNIRKPVFVKLTPNVSDIADVAVAAAEAGADALTAINTVRAMKIDIETGLTVLSNKIGGLSGAAIKPIAVRCVYEIYDAVEVPVIGCGG